MAPLSILPSFPLSRGAAKHSDYGAASRDLHRGDFRDRISRAVYPIFSAFAAACQLNMLFLESSPL